MCVRSLHKFLFLVGGAHRTMAASGYASRVPRVLSTVDYDVKMRGSAEARIAVKARRMRSPKAAASRVSAHHMRPAVHPGFGSTPSRKRHA